MEIITFYKKKKKNLPLWLKWYNSKFSDTTVICRHLWLIERRKKKNKKKNREACEWWACERRRHKNPGKNAFLRNVEAPLLGISVTLRALGFCAWLICCHLEPEKQTNGLIINHGSNLPKSPKAALKNFKSTRGKKAILVSVLGKGLNSSKWKDCLIKREERFTWTACERRSDCGGRR